MTKNECWNWEWIKNKFFRQEEIEDVVKTSEEVAPRKFIINLCKEIEAGEYIEENEGIKSTIRFNRNKDTLVMMYLLYHQAFPDSDIIHINYEITLWVEHVVVNLTFSETSLIHHSYSKNKDIKQALELETKLEKQQKLIKEIESWTFIDSNDGSFYDNDPATIKISEKLIEERMREGFKEMSYIIEKDIK